MVTELEKRFFSTFGIEPYDRYYNCKDNLEGECKLEHTCCCCDKSEDVYCYPEITDTHYLQLICKLSGVCCPHFAFERDISELKEIILRFCMHYKDQLKKSVQALFKE